MFRTGGIPSFAKEGWLRHKENGPVPYLAQTGWLFKPPIIRNRTRSISGGLKQPPRPLLFKGCFAAFFLMSRPPLLREGGEIRASNQSIKNQAAVPPTRLGIVQTPGPLLREGGDSAGRQHNYQTKPSFVHMPRMASRLGF